MFRYWAWVELIKAHVLGVIYHEYQNYLNKGKQASQASIFHLLH